MAVSRRVGRRDRARRLPIVGAAMALAVTTLAPGFRMPADAATKRLPTIAVTMTVRSERYEYGTLRYPVVKVDAARTDADAKVAADVVARCNRYVRTQIDDHLRMARDIGQTYDVKGKPVDGYLDITGTKVVSRPGLLVVTFAEMQFEPRGQSYVSFDIDTRTGRGLRLDQLVTTSGMAALRDDAARRLAKILRADGFSVDTVDGDPSNVSAWWPTSTGLRLVYEQASVGPMSEGTPEIEIPWRVLDGGLTATGRFVRG